MFRPTYKLGCHKQLSLSPSSQAGNGGCWMLGGECPSDVWKIEIHATGFGVGGQRGATLDLHQVGILATSTLLPCRSYPLCGKRKVAASFTAAGK